MAIQLEKKHTRPRCLIILDGLPPDKEKFSYSDFLPTTYLDWLVVMSRIINHTFSLSDELRISLEPDELKSMSDDDGLDLLYNKITSSGIQITRDQLKGHINVYISNSSMHYQPSLDKINTPIILFKTNIKKSYAFDAELVQRRAETYAYMFDKKDYGWSEYTKNKVTVYEYDCTHEDLMTGKVLQDIVAKIEAHLL
jgi:thioesterase domain-containing protein